MGETHKRNHYVPKLMLKHWEVELQGEKGVHTFMIPRKEYVFESSRGRRAFKFAAVEDLYVPSINGKRDLSMETGWFQSMEDALGKLIPVFTAREFPSKFGIDVSTALSMGLFALEHRSHTEYQQVKKYLEDHLEARALVSPNDPCRDIKQQVLENLVMIVTHEYVKYQPLEFMFLHATDKSFIITDRPTFTSSKLKERFVVLTNKLALMYRPTEHVPHTMCHDDITDDMLETINNELTFRSREWIVADSESTLQRYSSLVGGPEWQSNLQTESISPIMPDNLLSGWSFKE